MIMDTNRLFPMGTKKGKKEITNRRIYPNNSRVIRSDTVLLYGSTGSSTAKYLTFKARYALLSYFWLGLSLTTYSTMSENIGSHRRDSVPIKNTRERRLELENKRGLQQAYHWKAESSISGGTMSANMMPL